MSKRYFHTNRCPNNTHIRCTYMYTLTFVTLLHDKQELAREFGIPEEVEQRRLFVDRQRITHLVGSLLFLFFTPASHRPPNTIDSRTRQRT